MTIIIEKGDIRQTSAIRISGKSGETRRKIKKISSPSKKFTILSVSTRNQ